MIYEIGGYQEGGIKVTIVAKEEVALTHLYTQAVNRLMFGIRSNPDEAIRKLKEAKGSKVQATIDKLMSDYSAEGIKDFETSMRKGFKYIGLWNN